MVSIHAYESGTNSAVLDIKAGLEAALAERDLEVEIPHNLDVPGFFNHNIKVNKLVYNVVTDLDLPVLHTWYRYGQIEPYDELGAVYLNPSELDDPNYKASDDNYDEWLEGTSRTAPTRGRIRDYFLSMDLERIWSMNKYEFMNENYEAEAPRGYRDLYMANTDVLWDVEPLASHSDTDVDYSSIRSEFEHDSMDLRYKINKFEEFESGPTTHLERFLIAFEAALVAAEESRSLTDVQKETLSKGRTIYHENVWKWPAMIISLRESDGPDGSVFEFNRGWSNNLGDVENSFPQVISGWVDELGSLDLTPYTEDYRYIFDDPAEEFVSLESKVFESATTNAQG
jgi:hypothetical protein